jgi:16S rRNA (guanine527-N7)-methyltransferase
MSLQRVACPTAHGSRAAARWFSCSSQPVAGVIQCRLSYQRTVNHDVGGGGSHAQFTKSSRRHLRCVGTVTNAANVDTDALISSYLDERQLTQVKTFAASLLERNKHMNLTGASTVEEVLTRHVADSLALIPAIEASLGIPVANEDEEGTGRLTDETEASARSDPKHIRILDVGSGAGFPGMALAIARPNWELTLLDTLQKRTNFLEEAALECGAGNVKTLWSRAEDAGKVGSPHREAYDLVTARAVAELRVLCELCVPLVKVNGSFLAAKNSKKSSAEEVNGASSAVAVLGGSAFEIVEVQSVGPDGDLRTAVISEKVAPTPEKYPRRAGMPNKRPL